MLPDPPRYGRRTVLRRALLTSASLLTAGCSDHPPARRRLRIATGSPAAVYYAFGTSLAGILNRELPTVRASVVITAASAQNVALISGVGAELGFTQADALLSPPDDGNRISAIARIYDDLLHLVTRADGPIRQLADIRGRRVSVGPPGSGTEITVSRLLRVAGLIDALSRTERLGLNASVAALRAGGIDAFFFSGGLPVEAIGQFAQGGQARIIDLGDYTEPLRREFNEVYVTRDITTSAYGLEPVTTVADPNYLIAATSLPDDLVYEMTRLLIERRDELAQAHPAAGRMSRQSAIATEPLPMHPGAARYYRSTKP